ncbi:hypothetical protein, partial [Acetonema longum]|uniref:hypothetical protein n=1 Tax=Acetonema longum TaxID=2374 RepID=UPI0039B72311
MIYSGGNLNLSLTQDLTNQTATLAAAGQTQINAAAFANTANALLYSGCDLTLSADHSQNQTSTLKSGGLTHISGQTFTNRQGAYLLSENDLTLHAAEHLLNQGSSLNSQGTLTVTAQEAINQD